MTKTSNMNFWKNKWKNLFIPVEREIVLLKHVKIYSMLFMHILWIVALHK